MQAKEVQVQLAAPIEDDDELQDLGQLGGRGAAVSAEEEHMPRLRGWRPLRGDGESLFSQDGGDAQLQFGKFHATEEGELEAVEHEGAQEAGLSRMPAQDVDDVTKAVPGAVEKVLKQLQQKVFAAQNGELKVPRGPGAARPSLDGRAGANHTPVSAAPSAGGGPPRAGSPRGAARNKQEVDTELLLEKEQTIAELREMVGIMSEKIQKLEQLVKVKDQKLEAMGQKMQRFGVS
ncbi:unnamed protein product [Prorocentrum cordatum]|uniref:Uncharacterized protein n=1 Tax=Prorocentrum cordatum TaxID=2364126 RepID=A0ABN9T054_9DINO|nr:unnamed protein product [Polarella glacialis]